MESLRQTHGRRTAKSNRDGRWTLRLETLLARPVHGGSLAVFRISVGLVMALEAASLLRPSAPESQLEKYFTGAPMQWHTPCTGFHWLSVPAGPVLSGIVALMGIAAMMLAIGWLHRWAAGAVVLIWTYLHLLEITFYENHHYLEGLFAFLLIWLPASTCYSLDRWRRRRRDDDAADSDDVPFWTIFVLRFQWVCVFFFAGVTKLNLDLILAAQPMRVFLTSPEVLARFTGYVAPQWLAQCREILSTPLAAYAFSYAGLIFDLSIGMLLVLRRTRLLAVALVCLFHGVNHGLLFLGIGWFPLLGVLTITIFLNPDWPARMRIWLRAPRLVKPNWWWFAIGAIAVPFIGILLGWKLRPTRRQDAPAQRGPHKSVVVLLTAWLVLQAAIPLRHFLIPGDVRWTHQGWAFSWRLKDASYSNRGSVIRIDDPEVIYRDQRGVRHVNWEAWQGPPIVFRDVGADIDWRSLPEIALLYQPITGPRMIYNPLAQGADGADIEIQKDRLQLILQLEPADIRPTLPLPEALAEATQAYQSEGGDARLATRLRFAGQLAGQLDRAQGADRIRVQQRLLARLHELSADPTCHRALAPALRRVDPFSLEGLPTPTAAFLAIDHPQLTMTGGLDSVDFGPLSTPAVMYCSFASWHYADMQALPRAFVMDVADGTSRGPIIRFNSTHGVPYYKYAQLHTQPYLLHRYVQWAASTWQDDYGRRPAVFVFAQSSLNGRPYQLRVDPNVDLASTPYRRLGHNPWITNLQSRVAPQPEAD